MPRRLILTDTIQEIDHGSILDDVYNAIYVAPNVSLISRGVGTSGILGARNNHVADIAGTVIGLVGVNLSGEYGNIRVAESGLVIGDSVGVRVGTGGAIINSGGIFGLDAATLITGGRLTNYGHIDGSSVGVTLGESGTLINHGNISGSFNAVIGYEASTVTNFGTITGRLNLLGDGNSVLNAGLLGGTVQFGTGNDLLDSASGRITGRVNMGAGNDTFFGGDFGDSVQGGTGADHIELGGGNDAWIASATDGEDTIEGGAGLDLLDMRGLTQGAQVNLLLGTVRSGGETDIVSGFERVFGCAQGDYLTGNTGANQLLGLAGTDRIVGNAGNDTLFGGNDNDTMYGGDGNDYMNGDDGRDRMFGDAGDDVMIGSYDVDIMSGGSGADRFDFNDFEEFIPISGGGLDQITDFVRGTDQIDLSTIDADQFVAGNQAFVFVGTRLIDDYGELRFRQSGGLTIIQIGYGTASGYDVIRLNGLFTLTAADFIL